jgi:iron complex transport system ATP-binding protein
MGELRADDLTLGYGGEPIVDRLSLAIPAGRITALVGPNACGKSTLLRGLARLLKPRGGAVHLDGESIHRMPTKALARRLGLLPQAPTTPEGITVADLVARGRHPHGSWLRQWGAADEAAVEHALASTGTADLRDRAVDELSGGQRQRAWIALALAQETELMLLDEPTTYLDLAHQFDVLELLARLNADQGRTIVIVLHDLNQACRYADHLVALREGRIHAEGPPGEVVTEDLVREVFGLACRVIDDPITATPLCLPLAGERRRPSTASGARR